MRTMYDSVSPGSIPADATMVAGYADGAYANLTEMHARFPNAVVVSIAVRYTTRAQVLDVENGDATAAEAVLWCRQTMADTSNSRLTVYCNTSTWPSVRAAFQTAGETEPQYWVAEYDGVASIPAGAIAKQYRNTTGWDESVVADYWPGVDPTPTNPPEEDPLPFTEAQIRQFINQEVTNAVTSGPVRDSVAFATCWWLQKALTGTAVPTAQGGWVSLLPELSAALNSLSPAVKAQLEAAVAAALADSTVKVSVDVTGPSPAPAVKP